MSLLDFYFGITIKGLGLLRSCIGSLDRLDGFLVDRFRICFVGSVRSGLWLFRSLGDCVEFLTTRR